jgi:hypothetical protein
MLPVALAEEADMSKDTHIADIVVHLHPGTSCDDSDKIEQDLRAHEGVVSVHFSEADHPHSMVVAYNSDAVTSEEVLAEIRKCDSQAVMVGM